MPKTNTKHNKALKEIYKEDETPLLNRLIDNDKEAKDRVEKEFQRLIISSELYFLKKRIGKKIKEHREKNGLTQYELAKMLNTKQESISRIEKGKQNLSLKSLFKISKALSIEFVIK